MTQLFLLPVRTFLSGMGTMVEGLRAVQQIAGRSLDNAVGPEATRVTAGTVDHGVENNPVEEVREMSGYCCNKCGQNRCCCDAPGPCDPVEVDQDLSEDCCVKVVQYLIVSTLQGIEDDERICVQPSTVAFSNSMTSDGFVSWVIAEHCDELKHCNSKYLQVVYSVLGRYSVACIDLQEAQVAILGSIAETLKDGSKGLPAKTKG